MPQKIKVVTKERMSSVTNVMDMVTMPMSARLTQDLMMRGDPVAKRANIHKRKDVVVETAKAKTSPKPKVIKNVNLKEQLKVQKDEKARKVIGPRCQGMAKVRRHGRKDR